MYREIYNISQQDNCTIRGVTFQKVELYEVSWPNTQSSLTIFQKLLSIV